jgi:hypothetical protein
LGFIVRVVVEHLLARLVAVVMATIM